MSIADALNEAKIKISAVYTKCSEKGATLPEIQNLENLPATIDTVKSGGGDVVTTYVSGVTLAKPTLNADGTTIEPSDVSDIDVLLTKIGYQAVSSSTLSPNVRFNILNENGFVIAGANRYQIVNGVVDESTQESTTGVYSRDSNHLFMLNGLVSANLASPSTVITKSYVDVYTVNNRARHNPSFGGYAQFLDYAYFDSSYSGTLTFINDDLTTEEIELSVYTDDIYIFSNSSKFLVGTRDLFYLVHDRGSYNWRFIKFEKVDGDYVATTLRSFQETRAYSITSKSILHTIKKNIQTETGYISHILYGTGFLGVTINTQDETQSDFNFYTYPDNVLNEMGDRTINRIQTFYDGTFSFDLSDGTTFICKFTSQSDIEILEVIEPYIVSGDETVYHRNFTGTKMFWWQSGPTNAPITEYPWGLYTATKATVDYLAVPRKDGRWNTTVLTGVIRKDAQTAKPVFDETGRRLVKVETAIKDELPSVDVEFDWTIEDYNKVV